MSEPRFGDGDTSYRAAGEKPGLTRLVDAFYLHMSTAAEAEKIFSMHTDELPVVKEKLTVFLCGWLGGPKNYATKFGPIRIPAAHAHLAIDEAERDAWMHCMTLAVGQQDAWSQEFKTYFLEAISVPAERVRRVSLARREKSQK